MKRLLAISFLFSTVACMPMEPKEIVDRTGACPNGICSTVDPKPTKCNGAAQFSNLEGTFKSEVATDPKTFVIQRAQYTFNPPQVTFVQFCEKKSTGEMESPFLKSTFKVNSDVTKLRFNEPKVEEVKSKSFTCKAELTDELIDIKAEGSCLVLQSSKGKQYFVKQ